MVKMAPENQFGDMEQKIQVCCQKKFFLVLLRSSFGTFTILRALFSGDERNLIVTDASGRPFLERYYRLV